MQHLRNRSFEPQGQYSLGFGTAAVDADAAVDAAVDAAAALDGVVAAAEEADALSARDCLGNLGGSAGAAAATAAVGGAHVPAAPRASVADAATGTTTGSASAAHTTLALDRGAMQMSHTASLTTASTVAAHVPVTQMTR
jgi:hypothetical protein